MADALDPPSGFDGARLTLARQLRGLRKVDLAEIVGLTPGAITQFESGLIRPRAHVLAALALALGVPAGFFREHTPTWRVDEHEFHFRRLRSSRKVDRARVLARTALLAELIGALEQHVRLPASEIPTDIGLDAELNPSEAIGAAAARLRAHWGLGEGPIASVVRLLEAKGCIVARLRSDAAAIDAFSGWIGGRPFVVLSSDKEDAARSRFDAAHELGHLMLHPDADPTNRQLEIEAHAFASAFLMPMHPISRELPVRLDWDAYFQLKTRWGVSVQALLRRARDVGRLTPAQYRRAMTYMASRGWRTREPGATAAIEQPVLLATALDRIRDSKGLGLADFAGEIQLSEQDLERLLTDVLPLAS